MFKILKKIVVCGLLLGTLMTSAYASELSDWAKSDFVSANRAQLVPFSVGARTMSGNITREQFCELLVNTYERITNTKMTDYPVKQFTDCQNQAVLNAYGAGLVKGTSETLFSPGNPITRQEMAQMFYNMITSAGLEIPLGTEDDLIKSGYRDVASVSDWAKSAMATAVKHALINGVDGMLIPTGYTTREQAIVAANRLYRKFPNTFTEATQTISVVFPSEQAVINDSDVSIYWTPVSGISKYRVLIRDSKGQLVVNDTVATNSHTIVKSMFNNGVYNVSISAIVADGKEMFSIPVAFNYVKANVQAPTQAYTQYQYQYQNPNYNQYKAEYQPQTPAMATNEALILPPTNTTSSMMFFEATPAQTQTQAQVTPTPSNTNSSLVSSIFAEAEKHIGTPYLYGGTTPAGFDCSGFVQYVFKKNGITLKRTSKDQYASNGYSISKDQLQKGDLVFFGTNGVVGHVGIYAGNGQMIHSPSTGKTITYTSIESNYYLTHYIGAKRVL